MMRVGLVHLKLTPSRRATAGALVVVCPFVFMGESMVARN
jgi:hypothetical protein